MLAGARRLSTSPSFRSTLPVVTGVSSLVLTASPAATGASLTGAIARWNTSDAFETPSLTDTQMSKSPLKSRGGVREKVRVADSTASHGGNAPPPARDAEYVRVSPSASVKVFAGSEKR